MNFRSKKIVSKFRGKLVKIIRDARSRLFSLVHWGYELTENTFLMSCQINVWKWAIAGLIGKKSCKKQKKNIPKKKLLNIMHKTKKL